MLGSVFGDMGMYIIIIGAIVLVIILFKWNYISYTFFNCINI